MLDLVKLIQFSWINLIKTLGIKIDVGTNYNLFFFSFFNCSWGMLLLFWSLKFFIFLFFFFFSPYFLRFLCFSLELHFVYILVPSLERGGCRKMKKKRKKESYLLATFQQLQKSFLESMDCISQRNFIKVFFTSNLAKKKRLDSEDWSLIIIYYF